MRNAALCHGRCPSRRNRKRCRVDNRSQPLQFARHHRRQQLCCHGGETPGPLSRRATVTRVIRLHHDGHARLGVAFVRVMSVGQQVDQDLIQASDLPTAGQVQGRPNAIALVRHRLTASISEA